MEAKEEEEDKLGYCIYCFILHAGLYFFSLFTLGQGRESETQDMATLRNIT